MCSVEWWISFASLVKLCYTGLTCRFLFPITTGLQSPTPNLFVENQLDGGLGGGDIIQITQPPSSSSVPTSPLAAQHSLALAQHQPQQRPISFNNAKASTLDPNWQASKTNIRERNAAMFNNELMADIYFVVGPPGT